MQHDPALSDADVRTLGTGGAVLRDGWADSDTVARLATALDALDAAGGLSQAGLGSAHVVQPTLRGDRTTWLGDTDAADLGPLHTVFDGLRESLNAACWLGAVGHSVQLAVYDGDGARYAAHRDAIAGDPGRRATAILYLNPRWQPAHGGRLRMYLPHGTIEIDPVGGRLVIFLSDLVEHEVMPTFARRRAATAWFHGPSALLP